ncbi:MAG: DUF2092 domain-containing protein [Caulobacteraceae bacterium]
MILMTSLAGAALFVGNAASAPAAKPAAARPDVEPAAVQALNRMGAFIGTLQTFEVKSDTTEDVVLETGQKLQFTRQVAYRVRRPDGFTIETASDRKVRQFFYDGKQLTVVAPRAGFYATVDAPPTIQGVLDRAWDRYAISLPARGPVLLGSGPGPFRQAADGRLRRRLRPDRRPGLRAVRLPRPPSGLADMDQERTGAGPTQGGDHRPERSGPPGIRRGAQLEPEGQADGRRLHLPSHQCGPSDPHGRPLRRLG